MSDCKCYDCGLPYGEFGLDMVLPSEQWKAIFPEQDGAGLLCPTCICRRAARNPASTVIQCWVDRIDYAHVPGSVDYRLRSGELAWGEDGRLVEVESSGMGQ